MRKVYIVEEYIIIDGTGRYVFHKVLAVRDTKVGAKFVILSQEPNDSIFYTIKEAYMNEAVEKQITGEALKERAAKLKEKT